jgi:PAS domain S-box-containing protein
MAAETVTAPRHESGFGAAFERINHWLQVNLPEGRELPENQWRARHRAILVVIFAHAVGLSIFGLMQHWGPLYSFGEGALIALLGALAYIPTLGRRFRSSVSALALVTSSAVLVQFWGGYIEGHFHYFVIVAVVSLYQDWVPFLLAIAYVAVDHGAIGTLAPEWVYRNADAVAHPWTWAIIHAIFVLAECVALLAAWRASELARAHAELVLGSTGEAMLGLNAEGRITFANPAASSLTGVAQEKLVGTPVSRVLPSLADGQNGFHSIGGRISEGPLHRDGSTDLPVEIVQTAMRGRGAEGSVVAVKDLTERHKAEAERAQDLSRQGELVRLREQDAFKTLFINTAAHELRTPLTPIKIHIHVLQSGKRGTLNLEQQKTVDILKRNLDRLGILIEDVLNVSRLQAGHLTLDRKRMDLVSVLREARDSFQAVAERGGVALHWDMPDHLSIDGDSKRLSQVVFNLVDNALKFTPSGGRIDVTLRAKDGWAEVAVRDTGAGMSAENIARLFQPFVQVHDAMQVTRSGSGLGLYISRGILELHGGTIRCESAGPGKGTTFTFTVPLPEPGAPEPGPAESAAEAA